MVVSCLGTQRYFACSHCSNGCKMKSTKAFLSRPVLGIVGGMRIHQYWNWYPILTGLQLLLQDLFLQIIHRLTILDRNRKQLIRHVKNLTEDSDSASWMVWHHWWVWSLGVTQSYHCIRKMVRRWHDQAELISGCVDAKRWASMVEDGMGWRSTC